MTSAEGYYSRLEGLVSKRIRAREVLVTGAGAGSHLIEKLARCGIGIRVADPDIVEPENLTRTLYTVEDIGARKVDALARRIRAVNPWVSVRPYPVDICSLTEAEQAELLDGVDLIVAGTDHFPAQARANLWSLAHGIPAVFVGAHELAAGGRIVWTIPGQTPCYRCIAHERYTGFELGGVAATDLPGGHGLLCDMQVIDMVALKVSLALLDRDEPSSVGRFFTAMNGRNEIIVRTSPDYGYGNLLWDAVLSDLPRDPKPYADELKDLLCAPDTLWLRTSHLVDCADCGPRREP